MAGGNTVSSFADLYKLIPSANQFEAGTWFLVNNTTIAEASGDPSWTRASGAAHPVVLREPTRGPYGIVHARSATSPGGGVSHEAHHRGHDRDCLITKHGWVKIYRFPVATTILASRARCVEPTDSDLLPALLRKGRLT